MIAWAIGTDVGPFYVFAETFEEALTKFFEDVGYSSIDEVAELRDKPRDQIIEDYLVVSIGKDMMI